MSANGNKFIYGSILIGTCAVLCAAIAVQAQYNNYDSDANSDTDGGQTLSNAELGKLVRNSAAAAARAHGGQAGFRNQHQQQLLAATRNSYNRQPMQFAPTQHNRRQYGGSDGLSGYGPMIGGSGQLGRQASNVNNNDDDDEAGNFGPNFNANFDGGDNDGETNANAGEGQPMNLNQAASGYPGQGDYNENAAGFNGFGPSSGSGYSPSMDGSEFGPSDGYSGGEGRRAKSASSMMGSRNYGSDEDTGAPQYGPNSAVNSGDNDDEGRAGYAPEGGNDNDNDDE